MLAVTGSTGFVGRAVCAELDRSGTRYRSIGRTAAPDRTGVGDIGPDTDWREALAGISTVIHLAARVHRMGEAPADAFAAHGRTNRDGTLRLARQAQATGVRRLVFVSSVKVNGERTEPGRPFRAGNGVDPQDPYGRSKWEAEQGLRALAAETGLEVVVVRPPLVYGAGVGANFRALVSLVRRGLPLPLAGIRNKRSLIAVENLADLLLRCATHPQAPGATLLCSDGRDVSTPELLRGIGAAMGRPARLLPVPAGALRAAGALFGQGEAVRRLTESLQVDMAATCSRLDWAPPVSFDDALRRALGTTTPGRTGR